MSLPIPRESSVLRGVSLPNKGARLCGTGPTTSLWIMDGATGVTRMAFRWCPDVPPTFAKASVGDHQKSGHLFSQK